jgi:CheY-like chemotaxis protein
MDLVAILENANARKAVAVGTKEEALQVLDRERFDCVLLDGNLHGRPVDDIASLLRDQNTPFAFISGYSRDSLPTEFQDVELLTKPVSQTQLLRVVARLAKRSPLLLH